MGAFLGWGFSAAELFEAGTRSAASASWKGYDKMLFDARRSLVPLTTEALILVL